MNAQHLENVLARLYADPQASAAFLRDPHAWCRAAGLAADETAALVAIDRTGLALATRSYAAKRRARGEGPERVGSRLVRAIRSRARRFRRAAD